MMVTAWEGTVRSRLNKAPVSSIWTSSRNQVYLLLWKILVHETVFWGVFLKTTTKLCLFLPWRKTSFFLIKLAVRLCVRQIVTEPIICHSYHPECSHEDINRKRSHFISKEKRRTLFLRIPKTQIHTNRAQRWPVKKVWREKENTNGGRDTADDFTVGTFL